MKTHTTATGIEIHVEAHHVAHANIDADPVFLSIKEAFPGSTIGVWNDQIDVTFAEGTYFFRPSEDLESALFNARLHGAQSFPVGVYTASLMVDDYREGDDE